MDFIRVRFLSFDDFQIQIDPTSFRDDHPEREVPHPVIPA